MYVHICLPQRNSKQNKYYVSTVGNRWVGEPLQVFYVYDVSTTLYITYLIKCQAKRKALSNKLNWTQIPVPDPKQKWQRQVEIELRP
jgi:hypothetical protein